MDCQKDWAVIICLVGQGQEINKGEDGINEQFKALHNKFQNRYIYASKKSLDINNQFEDLTMNDNDKLFLYSAMIS